MLMIGLGRMVPPPGCPVQAAGQTQATETTRIEGRRPERLRSLEHVCSIARVALGLVSSGAVSSVNLSSREISVKVVYYGPGLGGKTSSLQYIHRALKPDSRGQLVSLATGVDRTLYFDFLPVKLPRLRGFAVRVQLYTVPGQVHYNSTRKLVLTGADGIVFVADSQAGRLQANTESLENLENNLREQGLSIRAIPLVIQYNKRDAPDALPVAELDGRINLLRSPAFETVATRGTGVFDALKAATTMVLADLRRRGQLAEVAPADRTPVPRVDAQAQSVPVPIADEPVTLHSLGEVAEAIEKLGAVSGPLDTRNSGAMRAVGTVTASSRALSELLPAGATRDAVLAVETDLERGDWSAALRRAGNAFADLSVKLSGALAGSGPQESQALAALLTGIPPQRYLRFREATDRVAAGGAVSSTDALFALFFLTDFALRADDVRKL
jgi:signal recognition particle receptor subunit beta